MRAPFERSRIAIAVAATAFTFGGSAAHAAGFLINESSASGLGTAFAIGAAGADDASTMWSNAAGLARLRDRQAVGVLHLITPSMKFRNGASLAAAGQPLGHPGGDAGGLNVVPNLYLAMPIDARWSAGLGVSAPFGLVTEYDGGWIGRFQAIKSSIQTINLNPAVAWRPNGSFSFGFGLNAQYIDATFTNQVNYSAALLSAAAGKVDAATLNAIAQSTANLESSVKVTGTDWAWGWNAGVLWEANKDTRLGAHYRSPIRYRIGGNAEFVHPTPSVPGALQPLVNQLAAGVNSTLANTAIGSQVKMPAIVNLSFFTRLSSRLDLMADAQWTQWSTIKDLTFVRADGSVLQSTPENFDDAWKVALGVNYRVDDRWMLRGGLARDRSPVRTTWRTARLPDADRTWLAGGLQYRPDKAWTFDFAAAYIWVDKAEIFSSGHPPSTSAYGLLAGRYDSQTAIVSAQVSYAF